MRSKIQIFIVLLLSGVALYICPLQSKDFNFDDHSSIENNDAIRTINIHKIFNAFNTRFLVGLSFALNYKWCHLDPAGYRLINVLIHCLNAFLVYLLAKFILGSLTSKLNGLHFLPRCCFYAILSKLKPSIISPSVLC